MTLFQYDFSKILSWVWTFNVSPSQNHDPYNSSYCVIICDNMTLVQGHCTLAISNLLPESRSFWCLISQCLVLSTGTPTIWISNNRERFETRITGYSIPTITRYKKQIDRGTIFNILQLTYLNVHKTILSTSWNIHDFPSTFWNIQDSI